VLQSPRSLPFLPTSSLTVGLCPPSPQLVVYSTHRSSLTGARIKSTYDFAVYKGLLVEGGTLEGLQDLLADREEVVAIEEDKVVRIQDQGASTVEL
jgi:hypothetical protein